MLSFIKKHLYFVITLSIIGLVAFWFGLIDDGNYGTTLFFTIPGSISFLIGYLKKYEGLQNSRIKKGLLAFFKINLIILILSGVLIAIGLEGAICILMAYPFLVLPMTASYLLGLFIGNADKNIKRNALIILLVINPSTYIFDSYTNPIKEEITSELIINTSKENIWKSLSTKIGFTNKPNILFQKGVSYPRSIEFNNTKEALSYFCITNNDTINLKITEFKNNDHVTFKPEKQTLPMKELSPYKSIDAEHLHNYFYVHYGKIKLESIAFNKTKIIAKTSYSYKIAPKWYWKLWSNYIIDEMQMHVLNSIKNEHIN
jgi:hypothetical protein